MESSSDILLAEWAKARPDIDSKQFEVVLRLRAISLLMDQRSESVAKSLSLKRREMYVLLALRRSGEPFRLRPTDIFKLLQVTSGTLTYRIDRLENLGLVRRVADTEDRRSMVVELTEKGRSFADKAVELEIEAVASPLRELLRDATSVGQLNAHLKRIGRLYDEAISPDENPIIHETVIK